MKWYGYIGFADYVQNLDDPTVHESAITEIPFYGDLKKLYKSDKEVANQINDDISINNVISVVANPFAMNNFHKIKYITFAGTKWKVTSVEVAYPRLEIYLGKVWTEEDDND